MRSKAFVINLLTLIVCLSMVFSYIDKTEIGIDDAINAYNDYQSISTLNDEKYVNQLNDKKVELENLKTQRDTLKGELTAAQDKVNQAESEREPEKGPISSEDLYDIVVRDSVPNTVNVEKYYSYDHDSYMVSLTGKMIDLNKTVQMLKTDLGSWNVNIGNYSLRQNYDMYDLPRSYDSGTMMEWFDNKIINALGEEISLDELLVPVEGQEGENTENTDSLTANKIEEIYTLKSLKDVKFDEEGMNLEITASNSLYEKKLNDELADYGEQLSILEKSEYTDDVKEDIRAEIDKNHEDNVEQIKTNKTNAENQIRTKYQQKYEKEMKEAADVIKTYQDKVAELKSTLVDSGDIEYRLDLTFICR